MQFETIIDNLKDILSHELGETKVYDKDVANALGLSKESLSHHKRKNTIPHEAIAYFCAKRQISINWVLFNQLPQSLEAHTQPYVAIKYFKELHASAGGGAITEESQHTSLYLPKSLLMPFFKTVPSINSLYALHVKGDSMEPTLFDGDLILVQSDDNYRYKGEIFILEDSFGLMVKRLYCSLDGELEIRSDNPNYTPIFLATGQMDDVKIYGRVLGKMEKP